MAERVDYEVGSTTPGSMGQVPLRVVNTPQGDVQEVALDDGTGTPISSSNPLPVIDQGALAASTDSVALGPNSATGATTYGFRNTAAFTTQTVKGTAGTLYALEITNASGAAAFVSVFDALSPTPGTTAPKVYATLAAGTSLTVAMGSPGRAFSSAITVFSATTDNGSTGSAAGVTVTAAYA